MWSVPMMMQAQAAAFDNAGKKRSRQHAVTLAGDHFKPYSTASTSLVGSASLPMFPPHLKRVEPTSSESEMLNNANATSIADESHLSIPEESLPSLQSFHAANKDWRWGDAQNSTITLPSEESGAFHHDRHVEKKRKGGKLGMVGFRDMLRALKRNRTEGNGGILASFPTSTANNGPRDQMDFAYDLDAVAKALSAASDGTVIDSQRW
jgi:serine/arginine repetitive matrix protein 2